MATGVAVVVDLPGLLTGALAVPITTELAFGTAGLGTAIAAVRATAAVFSVPVGRLADRIGATNSLRLTVVAVVASAVGIAAIADSLTSLAACLVVAGIAVAIGHPAANRLLSVTVPPSRQGMAFGIKQAAPPVASLLAGFSVPLIGLTVGWRWAFAAAAVLAAAMLPAIGRRPPSAAARLRQHTPSGPPARRAGPTVEGDRRRRVGMVWLGLGFGFATASAVVVPAFFVDSAVRAGTAVDVAGAVLALASASTVGVRVTMGFVADRMRTGHINLCGGLLAAGTIGLLLLGIGGPGLMVVGVVVGMSALWGFNGVFWYAVVRLGGRFPATITGVMSPAGHLGGSLGPLLFGLLAAWSGYRSTWLVWTVLAVVAAAAMLVAARLLPSHEAAA